MEVENTEVAQTTEGSTEQPATVETPEVIYAGKYKSVSELEKGYQNLQSKLGNFTGAPEAYEANEGIEVSEDNPLYSKLQELGKEIGLNNDGYNALVKMYNDTMAEQQAIYDQEAEAEFAKLGDNAQERVRNINDWSKANLSEDEQALLDSISTSAATVQLIEKFISMSKPQGIANDNQVQTRPTFDAEKVRAMRFELDSNGNRRMSTDAAFAKKVRDLEAQLA